MDHKKEIQRFEKILNKFPRVKILVIGDVMLDRFIWGKVSRISPEAPVPVVTVKKETFLLGGAANVVNNIHDLGGEVSLCGVVGDDEMGERILNELTQAGIQTHGIFIEPGRQTTVKTRIIAHQQQVVRIDRETTDQPSVAILQKLSNFIKEEMKNFQGMVISDYGKGILTKQLIKTVIKQAKETKRFIMVDPKPKNFFFYKGATVVTPNTKEVGDALGITITDEVSIKKAGRLLLNRLRCEALVITQGEKGMAIFEHDRAPLFIPTVAKEVYDVTGAGDTVIGTMAIAFGSGARIADAAKLANYAAGIVVGKVGTVTIKREGLIKTIREKL